MREREILSRFGGQLVKPYWRILTVAMTCMVMVAAMSAAQAYMVKPLLDEIFFNKDRVMLNLVPLVLIAVFLLKGFFYYSYSYLLSKVGQSVITDVRKRMYSHILSMPLSFFQKRPTGELISRIMNDVSLLQSAVSDALVGVLKDSFQVIFLLGVVFYQDWKLALMSILFLPPSVYPIIHFGKKHRRLSIKRQQVAASTSNILHETIRGNRIVKAFCMEKHEIARFYAFLDKLFEVTMRNVRLKSISHPLMEVLGGLGIAAIMWYGGNQVLNGTSTPGTFFSFLTALLMVYEPVKGLSKMNSTIQMGLAVAVRIFELLDIKSEVVERPDAAVLPRVREGIEFRSVSFSYDGQHQALQDINLTIRGGEVVAIVGTSGSGKSTLADLIPRFFDVTAGAIRIDGRDVRDVTLTSLRDQIAMVTQQTILFNDTVRNNIAYSDSPCPDEKVRAAARAAYSLDFIEKMTDGFESVIGESGARLSGGQRQRLAIARALLKDAPILILDEATSALDTESEREVQGALENLMKGRTTIVIAHRLSTIRNANRIVVMQEGRIVEEGTHEALLAKGGAYHALYHMQFGEEAAVS